MANIKQVLMESFIAGEDLSDYQYHGVVLTTTARTVDLADADTDTPVGCLQNDPESGEEAEVMCFGRTPIRLGGTVAVGALVRVEGTYGHYVTFTPGTHTTAFCVGICTIGGADGEMGEAIIWPAASRGSAT